jgi:hypothetical protein
MSVLIAGAPFNNNNLTPESIDADAAAALNSYLQRSTAVTRR